jgi:hypothetical protein
MIALVPHDGFLFLTHYFLLSPTHNTLFFSVLVVVFQELNREEVVKLLKNELNIEMGHAELEMMMDRLDPDHDG